MELDEADELVRTSPTIRSVALMHLSPVGISNGNRTPEHAPIYQTPVPS